MKKSIFVSVVLLVSVVYTPSSAKPSTLTPANTVIVSNETDTEFCTDFSVFLKQLSVEWIILESEIPEAAKEKNLIILGGPSAQTTGDIVKTLITPEEAESVCKRHRIFEKKSPWDTNRVVYVCAGSDRVQTKRAAEELMYTIMKEAETPEEWKVPFSYEDFSKAIDYVAQYQFVFEGEELPSHQLGIDLDSEIPEQISLKEAQEDTEYLFYLLSSGYSGYGYFKTQGDFDNAKKAILQNLETQSAWSPENFSELIHEYLSFVQDGHFWVGHHTYYTHRDFWYDKTLELHKTEGDYYFSSDNKKWKILTINERDPEEFAFPSLNAQGEPVYVLGVLFPIEPGPLMVKALDEQGVENLFDVRLYKSDFDSMELFSEENRNKIPIIVSRSFLSVYEDELEEFLQTAESFKDENYLILDIRGNNGGSTTWPIKWVEAFTGEKPEEKTIDTALISKTTLMGKINLYRQYSVEYPEVDTYKRELDRFEAVLDSYEKESKTPYWETKGLPETQQIPNETTIIVITDREVASAGEMFIDYLRQMENVIVIGENTAGVTVFAEISRHQLHNSKLSVQLPCRLFFPVGSEVKEGEGVTPDLWVPSIRALDYTLKAIENGTIITARSIRVEGEPEDEPTGCMSAVLMAVILCCLCVERVGLPKKFGNNNGLNRK